jgi:2-polyprenyl-6-methoxyphenol hydroxylase-like FAD-dependent oxidoreductase
MLAACCAPLAPPPPPGVTLSDGSQVPADLVVDCSGRQSQMPQWLAAAGLTIPREAEVNANQGYASWWVTSMVALLPGSPRGREAASRRHSGG